jgi:SAM-dependent methyltransferase
MELVNDIVALSGIPDDGRILEIGCGTGQATVPFAERGYWMTCLDIGEDLASIAAEKCRCHRRVTIQVEAFEDWQAGEDRYDIVMSATAFHWIAPEVGYTKAASVLKDSGCIALFWNLPPEQPYAGFFREVQAVYREIVPEWGDPTDRPSTDERIEATEASINNTGLFEPVQVRRYPWARDYTTEEYIRLLNTYSDHRSLDEGKRSRLFDRIGDLADGAYGGVVTRPYLAVLHIARKKGILAKH